MFSLISIHTGIPLSFFELDYPEIANTYFSITHASCFPQDAIPWLGFTLACFLAYLILILPRGFFSNSFSFSVVPASESPVVSRGATPLVPGDVSRHGYPTSSSPLYNKQISCLISCLSGSSFPGFLF